MVTANTDDVRATRGIVEPRARARCTGVMRAQCVHSRRSTVLRFARARNRQVYVTTTMCGIWKERAGRRDENAVRYPEGTGRSIRDDNDVRYLEGTSRSTRRQRCAVSRRNGQVDATTTMCGIWREQASLRDDNDVRYLEGTSRPTRRQRRVASERDRRVYVTTTCGIWKERAGRRDENAVRYLEGTGRSIRDDNDVRYLEGTGRSTGRQRRNRIRQVYITMTLRNVWQGV